MSKFKAGHKVRKQRTERIASDLEWWPGIVAMLAETEGFLTFHGYPTRGEGFKALLLKDWEDGESPIDTAVPADVVAAARAFDAACAVTYAIAHDESAALPVVMFLLGEEFLRFEILKTTPGLATEVATRNDGLPSFFEFLFKQTGQEFRRRHKMEGGLKKQLEKRREGLKPRNDALCAVALELRASRSRNIHLIRDVIGHFDKNDLWSKYVPGLHLTDKQVRVVLRAGNVLPPARKKNIGK